MPITWPAGSKPTLLIAADSSADSAGSQLPPRLMAAIRTCAAGGRLTLPAGPEPGTPVTARALRRPVPGPGR